MAIDVPSAGRGGALEARPVSLGPAGPVPARGFSGGPLVPTLTPMAVGTRSVERKGPESGPPLAAARSAPVGGSERTGARRLLVTDRRSLAVAAGLAVAVLALSWYRHATFRSGTMDLAVFDQAI